MKRGSGVALALSVALALGAVPGAAAGDPELDRGVRFVEEGDYDAAIFTLDGVARRLAAEPSRVQELSQAYLYLGVAYVAKGHEAAARAKFREAISRMKELSLSPDKFPPKVIDVFEAARAEAEASLAQTAAKDKKSGRKRVLLLGAGGAAAAVATVLLLGGGDGTTTDVFTSMLTAGDPYQQQVVGPARSAGAWRAELSWSNAAATAILEAYNSNGHQLARGGRANGLSTALEFGGQAGADYRFDFYFDSDASADPGAVQLTVRRPK